MTREALMELLEGVRNGRVLPAEAELLLREAPFSELGYATIDDHRAVRTGVGEVIYGAGKTPEQIAGIVAHMRERGRTDILITRMNEDAAALLAKNEPSFTYDPLSKVGVVLRTEKPLVGSIAVVSGGTSDMPVCEEAAQTAELFGNRVTRLYDMGVAGLHRLLSHLDELMQARVVIAVAGMEGALASVVGGLVACPVIAVPTSVGYGASYGGLAALLAMMNSCASGIGVVNIDNGFGAGYLASQINKMGERA